jgi:hypothetical protein
MRAFDVVTLRQLYRVFETRDKTAKAQLVAALNNSFIRELNDFYENVIAIMENGTEDTDTDSTFHFTPRSLINFPKTTLEQGTTQRRDFYLNRFKQ